MMQATRRQFIGTVLGTLVASKVPFTAVAEDRAADLSAHGFNAIMEASRLFRELWNMPESKLKQCFASIRLHDGTWIRGGPTLNVWRVMSEDYPPRATITWETDGIKAATRFVMTGVRIYTPDGKLIVEDDSVYNQVDPGSTYGCRMSYLMGMSPLESS